jgi:hypothetical protein
VKQVWALEELLRIIEEVEKKPSEKRTDVAKQLDLSPSTINMIIVKKIREHAYVSVDQELTMCGVLCVEEMCGELGSGSCVEVQGGGNGGGGGGGGGGGDDNEAEFYGSTLCV